MKMLPVVLGSSDPEALEEQAQLEQWQQAHLCNRCVHTRICEVSNAIHRTLEDGVIVSVCAEFQEEGEQCQQQSSDPENSPPFPDDG